MFASVLCWAQRLAGRLVDLPAACSLVQLEANEGPAEQAMVTWTCELIPLVDQQKLGYGFSLAQEHRCSHPEAA